MNYVSVISAASDKYGNPLLTDFMEEAQVYGLKDCTQEQAHQYCVNHNLVPESEEDTK
jgi:hypothetical protein